MNKEWRTVYVGIGSNMGNRRRSIAKAVSLLGEHPQLRIKKISALYETDPEGGPAQRRFLNGVICLKTNAAPQRLLRILQSIEKKTGRVPGTVKWGPRVIDLDILFYEDLVIKEKNLIVPHPLLDKRFFVLRPFLDISARRKHPVLGKTISRLFKELNNETGL
ncbi:MAG: 2-amino-4-hydroxy-6-hydroxymethyldihydropteridine diphosphokinase [Candidatus Omnitrophica bacterium]|nr:2-amino-4-hydroxy-6-hydroxymethyldihydropteridine diphosphokinase [Candidatus Omnitrophota bacterium]MBU4477976.1 2-amino-4-hydroxy-6-hydroxymethyldihydropteridine diphosphokinase [Candidatus Omnitrophota bacterium]MCG2703388.1 2-amino-4-hydroxy-6-hydroxymethyldihydropteridine diphosphokinase [Candidatus Omnitrophota bacterium]